APGEPAAEEALDAWIGSMAAEQGGLRLIAVFGERSREFATFQERGFRVHPSGHLLAGRSFDSRRDTRWWARHLHFTLADTDLV
ncbi:MAG: hypothetical protein V3T22_13305, partial [Planctomycetota bacterium]